MFFQKESVQTFLLETCLRIKVIEQINEYIK